MTRPRPTPANGLDRLLADIDQREPLLQALLPEPGRAARLRRESAALARGWPDPARRPPLFGVPVAIKDCIRVDGLPTRAGSNLPAQLFDGAEASAVTRLRRAGALVLGKAVTTEFTLGKPGSTRNPRDPAHTPGGSSSGSAAAVAAGYCPLALGTQTGGSVIRPAAYCGVIGFKPGFGRIPTDGIVPYAPSLDHVGIFARDLETLIPAAAILCDGWDPAAVTRARSGPLPRLGIVTGALLDPVTPEALARFAAVAEMLRAAGYPVAPVDLPRGLDQIRSQRRDLALGELAQVHARWFADHADLYSDHTAGCIRTGQQVPPDRLAGLRDLLPLARRQADADMDGIDLLLTPAAPGPAPAGLTSTGSSALNQPFTWTGQPALTLPCGTLPRGHLPLGLQLIARRGADEALIGWAQAIARVLDQGDGPRGGMPPVASSASAKSV